MSKLTGLRASGLETQTDSPRVFGLQKPAFRDPNQDSGLIVSSKLISLADAPPTNMSVSIDGDDQASLGSLASDASSDLYSVNSFSDKYSEFGDSYSFSEISLPPSVASIYTSSTLSVADRSVIDDAQDASKDIVFMQRMTEEFQGRPVADNVWAIVNSIVMKSCFDGAATSSRQEQTIGMLCDVARNIHTQDSLLEAMDSCIDRLKNIKPAKNVSEIVQTLMAGLQLSKD